MPKRHQRVIGRVERHLVEAPAAAVEDAGAQAGSGWRAGPPPGGSALPACGAEGRERCRAVRAAFARHRLAQRTVGRPEVDVAALGRLVLDRVGLELGPRAERHEGTFLRRWRRAQPMHILCKACTGPKPERAGVPPPARATFGGAPAALSGRSRLRRSKRRAAESVFLPACWRGPSCSIGFHANGIAGGYCVRPRARPPRRSGEGAGGRPRRGLGGAGRLAGRRAAAYIGAMKNPLTLFRRRDRVTVLRLEGVIGARRPFRRARR